MMQQKFADFGIILFLLLLSPAKRFSHIISRTITTEQFSTHHIIVHTMPLRFLGKASNIGIIMTRMCCIPLMHNYTKQTVGTVRLRRCTLVRHVRSKVQFFLEYFVEINICGVPKSALGRNCSGVTEKRFPEKCRKFN